MSTHKNVFKYIIIFFRYNMAVDKRISITYWKKNRKSEHSYQEKYLCAGANRISHRTQTLCPRALHFALDPLYLPSRPTYCYKSYVSEYALNSWSSCAPSLPQSHFGRIILAPVWMICNTPVSSPWTTLPPAPRQKHHPIILYDNLYTLRVILIRAVSICLEISRPPLRRKIAPEQNTSTQ